MKYAEAADQTQICTSPAWYLQHPLTRKATRIAAAVGEETAESLCQNQQIQRQFLPPGSQNAQLPPHR